MAPSTENLASSETQKKPRLAMAIATALGVGYIPKAPGTFGSLAGIAEVAREAFSAARKASNPAIGGRTADQ